MPVNASLQQSLAKCAHSYRRFAGVLTEHDRDKIPLQDIVARWQAHYFGDFAELDLTLMREARAERRPPDQLLAVSVSHHNLHRLLEVLELEIGSAPLSASQVPERILDLIEIVARLGELLKTNIHLTAALENHHA